MCALWVGSHYLRCMHLLQAFSFTQPPDVEEKAAQAARKQRIKVDVALDDDELPEQRWPFRSPRGKV